MKKILSLLLIVALVIALSSCAGTATSTVIVSSNPTPSLPTSSQTVTEGGTESLSAFAATSSEDISSLLAEASSIAHAQTPTESQGQGGYIVKVVTTIFSNVDETSSVVSQAPVEKIANILPIGETTTVGALEEPTSNGYRAPLYNLYKQNAFKTTFVGIESSSSMPDGNNAHSAYRDATLQSINAKAEQISKTEKANVLMLMLGRNDIIVGTSPDTFYGSYQSLLSKLRDSYPNALIYISTIPPTGAFDKSEEPYNQKIAQIVDVRKDENIKLIDLSTAGLLAEDFSPATSNRYPNEAGYQKIATAIFNSTQNDLSAIAK